jgi:DNA-binding transcriptional ArsR family regulator
MQELSSDEEAGVFRALADPTRRQILQDLRAGEQTAGDIGSRFPISAPSVSRHLGVLKGAGLIRERREANRIFYTLVEDRLALCVGRFLSAVCPEQVVVRARRRSSPESRESAQAGA